MEKRFQLKQGDKVLATLTKSETGVTLNHDLTEDQLRMLPTVMPFDESGTQLNFDRREGKTFLFSDNTGLPQLKLDEDEDTFLLDVRDTKGLAGLRTKIPL
ncbi:MAG: hypothetical protein U1E51_33620, partial [Candidatus Binatia bacterium]|nr:hypothetical protein [Candidatus Binatia bacterium]